MTKPTTRPAFTMIELLVVVAIIAILLAAVVGVSRAVIAQGKSQDTAAMLQVLDLAIKQFRDDKPLAKVLNYNKRYTLDYPPDELEAFSVADDVTQPGMFFFNNGPAGPHSVSPRGADLSPTTLINIDNRGVKAMVLAINLYSSAGAAILEKIDGRFRRIVRVPGTTAPAEFLDGATATPPTPQIPNEPLTYYVDSWGTPIDYFSTRSTIGQATGDLLPLPNARRDASTAFVHLNDGLPLLVSYGPDGRDQFSPDFIASEGNTDLVADYWDNSGDKLINHRLNEDNVYSNPQVTEKLRRGVP